MAAQPEPTTRAWDLARGEAQAAGKPSALVLPMRLAAARGRTVITEASGDRVGPARGLVVGLACGLVLWAGIIWLVEGLFR